MPLAPRAADAVAAAQAGRTSGPLLRDYEGNRLDRHDPGRIVRRLAHRTGLPPTNPHALRHAFVTAALDTGAPLRVVQDAAGHADPRTTRCYDRSRSNLDRHPTYAVVTHFIP